MDTGAGSRRTALDSSSLFLVSCLTAYGTNQSCPLFRLGSLRCNSVALIHFSCRTPEKRKRRAGDIPFRLPVPGIIIIPSSLLPIMAVHHRTITITCRLPTSLISLISTSRPCRRLRSSSSSHPMDINIRRVPVLIEAAQRRRRRRRRRSWEARVPRSSHRPNNAMDTILRLVPRTRQHNRDNHHHHHNQDNSLLLMKPPDHSHLLLRIRMLLFHRHRRLIFRRQQRRRRRQVLEDRMADFRRCPSLRASLLLRVGSPLQIIVGKVLLQEARVFLRLQPQ
jgi:hypothetical protein